ncbi:hypothetical protein AB1K70_13435 [Bremerella sp. JC770]|uniref:hypothetical protein n=1 Tax=Bremerella sp. JC770 TaxID=3232137 RepID=UPI00345AA257
MRCTPIWSLVLVLSLATSAWAQFGGGGGGFGGRRHVEDPFAMGGYASKASAASEGIDAYRPDPEETGRFEVTWTGTNAQASQKVAEKLRDAETKIQFIDTRLIEVVAYLEQLHKVPTQIGRMELKRRGIDVEMPITFQIESLTLPAALDLLVRQYELGWYIEGGVLIVTSHADADARLSTRIYKLHQLDATAAAKVVANSIFPSSWSANGGHADMTVIRDRNVLVVRQNREGHDAIEPLLKALEEMK